MKGIEKFHLKPEEEPVGDGGQQSVYNDPHHPDRVIAIRKSKEKESPNVVKGRYYLGKILHLLFPDNIADIHLSSSEPNATVRQKLDLSDEHIRFQKLLVRHYVKGEDMDSIGEEEWKRSRTAQENAPLDEVRKLGHQLEDLGLGLDGDLINFPLDKTGKVKYVEVPDPFYHRGRFYDPDALKKAINKLGDNDREQAMSYFDRLEILYKQEQEGR